MLKALFYPDVKFESLFIPHIFKEIYFDGVYIDILNQRKDMVIVDVGANIGITVHHFRNYAKKVYAIEPSTEHFEALKMNKEYNKWDNVEIFKMAIADKDGEMELALNSHNRTCHSLVGKYGGAKEKVKTMAMDTFFNENKIVTCDFMKFDVEGADDMILRSEGFKNVVNRIKAIEVEFHSNDWPNLADYLVSLGYTPRRYPCSAIVLLFTR